MKIVEIDPRKASPKYKQIVSSIETAIMDRRLRRGDKLPSLNKIALEYKMSRDTVMLAYEELKKRGILYAESGKGYFVKSENVSLKQKIFLLFDELNTFKEDLYNSFIESLGSGVQVDVFFHYFNPELFRRLIEDNNGNYSKYIIMPTTLQNAAETIKLLPKDDVYILDQTSDALKDYPSVYQNFIRDIYNALNAGYSKLGKYNKIILVDPVTKQPPGIETGMVKFCREKNLPYEVTLDVDNHILKQGDVYIITNDLHLVAIIEKAADMKLKIGKDIGIISYNDTPLKKIIKKGITTISTDFREMGRILAEMVLYHKHVQIENNSRLIERASL